MKVTIHPIQNLITTSTDFSMHRETIAAIYEQYFPTEDKTEDKIVFEFLDQNDGVAPKEYSTKTDIINGLITYLPRLAATNPAAQIEITGCTDDERQTIEKMLEEIKAEAIKIAPQPEPALIQNNPAPAQGNKPEFSREENEEVIARAASVNPDAPTKDKQASLEKNGFKKGKNDGTLNVLRDERTGVIPLSQFTIIHQAPEAKVMHVLIHLKNPKRKHSLRNKEKYDTSSISEILTKYSVFLESNRVQFQLAMNKELIETATEFNQENLEKIEKMIIAAIPELSEGTKVVITEGNDEQRIQMETIVQELKTAAKTIIRQKAQSNDAIGDAEDEELKLVDDTETGFVEFGDSDNVPAVPTTWEKRKHLWVTLIVIASFLVLGALAAILVATVPPLGALATTFLATIMPSLAITESLAAGLVFASSLIPVAVTGLISFAVHIGQLIKAKCYPNREYSMFLGETTPEFEDGDSVKLKPRSKPSDSRDATLTDTLGTFSDVLIPLTYGSGSGSGSGSSSSSLYYTPGSSHPTPTL